MKYSEMSPREIDKLVADKVMHELMCSGEFTRMKLISGWQCVECYASDFNSVMPTSPHEIPEDRIPRYSTSVDAAISAAKKFDSWKTGQFDTKDERYYCQLRTNSNQDAVYASGDTLPEAICRAALKACGIEIE